MGMRRVWLLCLCLRIAQQWLNHGTILVQGFRILGLLLESCGDIFNGVGSLVDVGGGNGSSLSILVKAFPWMKGINFDLSNVVSTLEEYNGVEHVCGNMFDYVPKADDAFFMVVCLFVFMCVR
ncbi:unnamed protein product, partial [Citrullus colocynthis]